MKAHSISKSTGREAQDSSLSQVNLVDRFPVSKRQQAKARSAARKLSDIQTTRDAIAHQIETALSIFGGHVVAVVTE